MPKDDQSIDSTGRRGARARPAVQSHLEAILFELEQVRMVGAEQKCAAAGVGVGVADLLGAAALTADRDVHFESLHARANMPVITIIIVMRHIYQSSGSSCALTL